MEQNTNRAGVPLWLLGILAVLVVLLVLAFSAQQQAAGNAAQASTAQAQAEVAQATAVANAQQANQIQSTQEQQASQAQSTASAALAQAQSEADNAATQIALAQDSAATAAAAQNQAEVQATEAAFNAMMVTSARQEQATQAGSYATLQAEQFALMQMTLEAQSQVISAVQAEATVQAESLEFTLRQVGLQSTALFEAQMEVEGLGSVQARSAAAQSILNLESNYPAALLMGVEAFNRSGGEISDPLRNALSQHPDITGYLNEHTDSVYGLAYSPDGRLLASGGRDGTVMVWDTATHQRVSPILSRHSGSVFVLAYSPDGKMIASAGSDNVVILWDTSTWQPRYLTGHTDWIYTLAFSPDSKTLASGSNDQRILLWDTATGEAAGELNGHSDAVRALAYSPDGSLLASGGADASIILWNMTTRSMLRQLEGHESWVNGVAFNPNGKTLASAGDDLKLILWDVRSGEQRATLSDLTFTVSNLAFSPDGQNIVTVSDKIQIWNAADGSLVNQYQTTEPWTAAYSPDSSTIALSDAKSVVLWQPTLLSEPAEVDATNAVATACALVGRNLTLSEWQSAMANVPYQLTCPNVPMHSSVVAALADKAYVAAQAGDSLTAAEVYMQAVELLPQTQDVRLSNTICWYGSLYGLAEIVLPACEHAVELSGGNPNYVDSRGLARALTGDTENAIADFQVFADWAEVFTEQADLGLQRLQWITALAAGDNPFDEATLQALRKG